MQLFFRSAALAEALQWLRCGAVAEAVAEAETGRWRVRRISIATPWLGGVRVCR